MTDNYWLGDEELVISYQRGTHIVISSQEEDPIYRGSYEKCKEFCEEQETAYQESLY